MILTKHRIAYTLSLLTFFILASFFSFAPQSHAQIQSFTASPSATSWGGSTTLNWSCDPSTPSAWIVPDGSLVPKVGSKGESPLTNNSLFRLNCMYAVFPFPATAYQTITVTGAGGESCNTTGASCGGGSRPGNVCMGSPLWACWSPSYPAFAVATGYGVTSYTPQFVITLPAVQPQPVTDYLPVASANPSNSTVYYEATTNKSWCHLDNGAASGDFVYDASVSYGSPSSIPISISADPTFNTPGTYYCTITITNWVTNSFGDNSTMASDMPRTVQIPVIVQNTPPTITMSASPNPTSSGGQSTITWTTTNATSCTASGGAAGAVGWSGSKAVGNNQTQLVTNITAAATYFLNCTGSGGSNTGSVAIGLNSPPTVTSPTGTSITSSSATLGANVTSLGVPASISARGTCWGTTPAPTTNCAAEGGTSTGVYTQARNGLPANSTIYYRGYATNSTGTGYSADGTFSTSASPINGTCGTANGQSYPNGSSSYGSDTQCGNGNSSNGAFPTAGNSVTWTCSGQNGGSASGTCSASQQSAAAQADLTAGAPSPSTATVGSPVTFSALISNNGGGATGGSFPNFFQVAVGSNGGSATVVSQTVSEGGTASLTCSSGTISSYTSLYGSGAGGSCPVACGTCTIGASLCSVTYNNALCGDCSPGVVKNGDLSLTCGSGSPPTDLASNTMSALGAGASNTATSPSYTFAASGPYSVRACADKTSSGGGGSITESNEGNNCGPWANVTVNPGGGTTPQVWESIAGANNWVKSLTVSAGQHIDYKWDDGGTGTSWSSTYSANPATTWCGGNPPVGGWVANSGSGTSLNNYVDPCFVGYTFTISYTSTNASGSNTDTMTQTFVNAGSAPTVTSFIATPNTVTTGGSSNLSWACGGGSTSGSISPGGFSGLTGNNVNTGALVTTTTYTLTCSAAGYPDATAQQTVTVNALPVTYTLTVNKTIGGKVTSDVGGINCGVSCSQTYNQGTVVHLTATPDSMYWKFIGWTGNCSGTGQANVTVNSNKVCTANFAPKPFQYQEF